MSANESEMEIESSKKERWVVGWILGLFASIVVGGGGAFISVLNGRLNELDRIQLERGERLSKIEATVNQMDPRIQRIESKMDGLDQKIDLLLKRR